VVLSTVAGADTDAALSLDPSTGLLSVAGGTAAGTYTLRYRMCEASYPTNCAEAVETVTVTDSVIAAGPEATRAVTGADAAVAAGSALDAANDTLGGAPATPGPGGNVVLTRLGGDAELLLDTQSGTITVAAGTAAGTYGLSYEICEATNTDNCADAAETVTVTDTSIAAGAEPQRDLAQRSDPQSAGSVLSDGNDLLGGAPARLTGATPVLLTLVSADAGLSLNTATGEMTVAAGQAVGTHSLTYQICEAANQDNCQQATETVYIYPVDLEAEGTHLGGVDARIDTSLPSIFADDHLDGAPVDPLLITVTETTDSTGGYATLDPATGTLIIAEGAPSGPHSFAYTICETAFIENCAQATETFDVVEISTTPEVFAVLPPAGGNAGSVLGSDILNGDTPTSQTVVIHPGSGDAGLTVTGTGELVVDPGLPAGPYTTSYSICSAAYPSICADGTEDVHVSEEPALEVVVTNTLVDNGDDIGGVGDHIIFAVDVTNTGNAPLADLALTPTLMTIDGEVIPLHGALVFDHSTAGSPASHLEIGETATYYVEVPVTAHITEMGGAMLTVEGQGEAMVSGVKTGTLAGDVSDDGDDSDGNTQDDPSIRIIGATTVALDISIAKTAGISTVRHGGQIPYRVVLRNSGDALSRPIQIVDELPLGVALIPGSVAIDGNGVTASVSGRKVRIAAIALPPASEIVVTYTAQVLPSANAGILTNTAVAVDLTTGTLVTGQASADVRLLADPVFECSDVIGKVFDDKNANGRQDAGEAGIKGARVVGVDGLIMTTDAHGRYHVPCAALPKSGGSNFILKLDTRSLPTGARLTTENPHVVRVTPGKMVKLNFGVAQLRVVRIDLSRAAFDRDGNPSAALDQGLQQLV
ncbi:MAG: hypothetical protein AAF913_14775, partial [Pseudomonadota bacterium]